MSKLNVFVPITKVDAIKGIVYGTLCAEETDRVGEVFDYAGSKPYFERWSENASKATGGKSLGNLRAMHGAIAAGKFTDMSFIDDDKRIQVAAKIVDKNELDKVLEGVYTGFSIGGKYVKRWKDGDVMRYIADPYEGSLVDLPCIESATFEVVKADGVTIKKSFNPVGEVEQKARELAKAAGSTDDKIDAEWPVYEADAIEILAKAASEPAGEAVVEPTNDEIAAEARVMAKAAGAEANWIDHIEAARTALKAKGKKKPDAKGGKTSTKDREVAAAEGETDKDDDEGLAPNKAATVGDDEPWVQKWTHPDLPGQAFDKKADLRNALAAKRATAIAAPATEALAALRGSLDIRERAIKGQISEIFDKAEKDLAAACGLIGDDYAVLTAFINKNASAAGKLASLEISLDKTTGKLIEVPPATKAAILDALNAARDDLAKRDFTDDQRAKMAKDGSAMKDGSFPIATKADLKNAVQAFGRAKNKAAAKRHIIRRAKALGAAADLPADWGVKVAVAIDMTKFAAADVKADLKKAASLYGVSSLISLLAQIDSAEESLEAPGYGYGTMVPKDLCTRFGTLLVQFGDLVAEVLDEVLQGIRDEESEEAAGITRAAGLMADLAKHINDQPLVKVGARHSRTDQNRLNDAHDLLVDAGAMCDAREDDDEAAKGADVGELRKIIDVERGVFAKSIGDITTVLKEVAERVKRIEAQPMPEGTSHVNLVEKNGEQAPQQFSNPNARAYAELAGDMVGMAIKASQVAPVHGVPGNSQFGHRGRY